jgi:hypothetical protein
MGRIGHATKEIMPTIEYERPFIYPYQKAILDSKARFTVCEAATKVGKTASHIIWLFEQALVLKEGQAVWWVAPSVGQAKIAYDRMKLQITNKDLFTSNETNRVITLITGGKLEFKTAENPDALYGDDVYAAVFDEFTRARETAWFALRSTLTSTGGKCKFIGNVKGKRNWGHKLAMKAKGGNEQDYEYFKITAYDAAECGMMTKDGRLFIEEISAAKRDLPDHVFKELYLAEPSEDGTHPFGLKFIELCCHPGMSTRETICYGIDLARKIDWVSIIGLDQLGAMSHRQTFTKVGWQTTIDTIKVLPQKPMAMDSTGVGDVVVSQVEPFQSQLEPVIFTQASKQMLMEGLAVAIQSRKIIIADDGDVQNGTGRVRHQLEQFEMVYTRTGVKYSAPEGEHDDDVVALALAWHKYKTASSVGQYSFG